MFRGSCLCGAVQFQATTFVGPFELCHCPRCRKVTGSAFMPGIAASADGFQMTGGVETVREFRLAVSERPPAYSTFFCVTCGSPVPDPSPAGDSVEIPAGSLDDDPGVLPGRHIYVDHPAAWSAGLDQLPRYTKSEIRQIRESVAEGTE